MFAYKRFAWLLVCLLTIPAMAFAQEAAEKTQQADEEKPIPDKQTLIKQLEKSLTGAKMTGQFTVVGREDAAPKAEEYTIVRAMKIDKGDFWLITARVKYGDKDYTTPPLPMEIKWAGDTPVITLTDFVIPGQGKFDARVVIYNKKYAGTWRHDKVGGHLFGTIEEE